MGFRMWEAAEMKMDKMKILILLQFMFAAVVSSKGGDYSGDEPMPPLDVQVSGCKSLSAYLTWRASSGVMSYHVYVAAYGADSRRHIKGSRRSSYESDGSRWGVGEKYITVSGGNTVATIDLSEWGQADFEFRVRSEYPSGSSDYTEAVKCSTFDPAPENVRLGVCGQNSMEVLWDHPKVSDDVREYVIESKQRYSEKPVEYEEMLRIDGSETSIVVELPLGRSVKTHIYALTGTGRSKSVDIPDC